MKYIVTGGAGFIGSNLVDKLIDEGHEVIIFDDLSTGENKNLNPKARFIEVDISKSYFNKYKKWFKGVDTVFHLAALARVQESIENPIEYHNTNVNGMLNVLNLCTECGVKRFVFSSSSSVYGDSKHLPILEESPLNPMSPYALHKSIGEQYCTLYSELYGLETVSLRYFNVYGERQPTKGAYCLVMGIFARQRLEGKPMTIRGDGEQRRDFTYVGDVVDANIQMAFYEGKLRGAVLNVGSGTNYSVNQVADMIGGDRINVESVIEPRETLADIRQIMECFDWQPTMKLENWIPKWKKEIGIE